jgi:crossover junction endodeoxyribonuclease RuvC
VLPLRSRVLGLDPGSLRTGYGVIEVVGSRMHCVAQGRIDVSGHEFAQRLRLIHGQVSALISEHAPGEVAVERVFVNRNVDSALKLGQARGAALAALPADVAVFEYAPRAIKLAAVGFGGADKQQVAHMVRQLLRLGDEVSADAADALAVALCHAHERQSAARLAAMLGSEVGT